MTTPDDSQEIQRWLSRMDAAADLASSRAESHRLMKSTLLRFLEVADAIEEMLRYCERSNGAAPMKSVAVLSRLMKRTLQDSGVDRMEPVGGGLDLERHQVVSCVAAGDDRSDIVVQETVVGYLWKGEVLRRAQVIVSTGGTDRPLEGKDNEP